MRALPFALALVLSLTSLMACGDKDDDDDDDDDTGSVDDVDADGDGFTVGDGDCDDDDSEVNPDATEVCDDIDNDCDDAIDGEDDDVDLTTGSTFYGDSDGDGYGAPDAGVDACAQPEGTADTDTDCDDDDAAINPGATEVCDAADVDEDCSGDADDADAGVDSSTQTAMYPDADTDGYGDAADAGTLYCDPPSGTVSDNTDCDDADIAINPDATEVCDDADTDEDCDGLAEDADDSVDTSTQNTVYADVDTDGYGDMDDAGTLTCDPASTTVLDNTDCDDSDIAVNPGATEVCDDADVDEDCSGTADDADRGLDTSTRTTWYADADTDTYGDVDDPGTDACDAPSGTVADQTDCDDGDGAVNPAASEVCDGVDNDCDSSTSEDGMVSFETAAGVVSDVSSTFTAGTSTTPATVAASTSGTYWFCDGTYYANIEASADVTFAGVGSAGVLDGAGTDSVLNIATDSISVWVEDLTLQNGVGASASIDTWTGGGNIACVGTSDLYLSGVVLQGGTAFVGGGLAVDTCNVDIDDSTITGNASDTSGAGGGIFVFGGSAVTVSDSSIDNNEATFGGGFYLYDAGSVDLLDTLVSDNTADYGGGGSVQSVESSTVSEVTCEGDTSTTSGFTNNTASGDAGAIRLTATGGDYLFTATDCDFGTLADGTSNDSTGLLNAAADWYFNVGDDADFICDSSGCGTETETSLASDSYGSDGDDRIRGNVFLATAEGTIDDFAMTLDPDSSCVLDYYVLSNTSFTSSGWTVVYANTGNAEGGGGADDYGVTDAGVGVQVGMHYAVVAGWMCADSGEEVGYWWTSSSMVNLDFAVNEGSMQENSYSAVLTGSGNTLDVYGGSQYLGTATTTTF
jgi:hypothetical protein